MSMFLGQTASGQGHKKRKQVCQRRAYQEPPNHPSQSSFYRYPSRFVVTVASCVDPARSLHASPHVACSAPRPEVFIGGMNEFSRQANGLRKTLRVETTKYMGGHSTPVYSTSRGLAASLWLAGGLSTLYQDSRCEPSCSDVHSIASINLFVDTVVGNSFLFPPLTRGGEKVNGNSVIVACMRPVSR